jgi:serine/threonine protein kinase
MGILEGTFEEHWEMKGEVGRGATSRVYICKLKSDEKVRGAVKVVNKNRLGFGRRKKHVLEHIRNEIDVLKSLDHPCIIRILASYECADYIHIVTELMEGGELFEYIVDEAAHLTEKEASNIVSRVARALDYMHSKGVLHRDLKPENMLLKKPGDPSEVKIIDFGFSKNCVRTESFLGTHGYLAPEMMAHEEYTMAVDMWALGVCVYALISGYLPFDEVEMPEPGCEIEWVVEFPEEQWLTVSADAKDLIERLLEPDPTRRLTARQVLSHPVSHQCQLGFFNFLILSYTAEGFHLFFLFYSSTSFFSHFPFSGSPLLFHNSGSAG